MGREGESPTGWGREFQRQGRGGVLRVRKLSPRSASAPIVRVTVEEDRGMRRSDRQGGTRLCTTV